MVKKLINNPKQAEEVLLESKKNIRQNLYTKLSPEKDIEVLKLSDIIDSEKIQQLMDQFYRLTNIGIGILDLEGNVLVETGWQEICTKFHRVNEESCKLCTESDLILSRNVSSGEFKKYKCKNNLWDMVTPIILNEQHVGNIFLGQFLFDDEEVDDEIFREQARRYGFDEKEYLTALNKVPRWSQEKIDAVMSFYTVLSGIIGDLSYSRIKLTKVLDERNRATEALNESEDKFRRIAEQVNEVIFLTDNKGTIKYISPASSSIFGFTPQEMESQLFVKFLKKTEIPKAMKEFMKTFIKGSPTLNLELLMKHKNGNYFTGELTGKKYHSDTLNGTIGVIRDISESKKAEVALIESEKRLRTIMDTSPFPTAVVDMNDDKILYWSKSAIKLFGHNPKTTKEWYELAYPDPDYREDVINRWKPFLEKAQDSIEAVNTGEYNIFCKDGSIRICELYAQFIPGNLIVSMNDITERKKSEVIIKENEEKYRSLVEGSLQGIIVALNDPLRIPYASPQMEKISGYSTKEFVAFGPEELAALVYEDDRGRFFKIFADRLSGKTVKPSSTYRIHHKDGSIRWVEVFSTLIQYNNEAASQTVFVDITERKLSEEKLRESEQRQRMLFENMTSGVAIYEAVNDGKDFIIKDFNNAAERIENVSRDNIIGKRVTKVFPGVREFGVFELLQRVFKSGKPEYLSEALYRDDKDSGSWRESWVYKLPSGEIVSLYNNISDRKQIQIELSKSRDFLHSVIENVPIRVFWKDRNLRYLGCNTIFAQDAGESQPENLIGKDDFQMTWKDQAELYRADDKYVMDSNIPKLGFEEPQTTPDGHTIWLRSSKVPFHDVNGKVIGLLGVYEDITEQKKQMKKLKQVKQNSANFSVMLIMQFLCMIPILSRSLKPMKQPREYMVTVMMN